MASATSAIPKKPVGRPEKDIDWNAVDRFLEMGATGVQIAAYFHMHRDSFYDKIKEKYGMYFSEYSAQVTPKGEMQLLAKQHEEASKGNTRILIMLGEERLGQGRKKEIEIADASLVQFEAFTKMLEARQAKPIQSVDLESSERSSNAESKS